MGLTRYWFLAGCDQLELISPTHLSDRISFFSPHYQNHQFIQIVKGENLSPVKEFQNLTTAINSLEFGGPNGELLAFSSCGNWTGNEDEEALSSYIKKSEGNFSKYSDAGLIKIAHVASRQVYSQFPQQTSERGQLGIIQHSMFSPNGKFMLVQNSKGKLPLYRLGHNFSY